MKYVLVRGMSYDSSTNHYTAKIRCSNDQMLALAALRVAHPRMVMKRNEMDTEDTHVVSVIVGYGMTAIRRRDWEDEALMDKEREWMLLCTDGTTLGYLIVELFRANLLHRPTEEE